MFFVCLGFGVVLMGTYVSSTILKHVSLILFFSCYVFGNQHLRTKAQILRRRLFFLQLLMLQNSDMDSNGCRVLKCQSRIHCLDYDDPAVNDKLSNISSFKVLYQINTLTHWYENMFVGVILTLLHSLFCADQCQAQRRLRDPKSRIINSGKYQTLCLLSSL